MTLNAPHLPDYVELGGRQVYRPPYTARNTTILGFALRADRHQIDELLRKALNEPAHGAVDYRCAHDHVMVTFANIERLASGDPIDSKRGWMSEREVTVWCLVADAAAGDRLLWYLPYVFTDSGQTVSTGREVYGYAKQIGTFPDDFAEEVAHGGTTLVEALAIDPFPTNQPLAWAPMISTELVAAQAPIEDASFDIDLFRHDVFGILGEEQGIDDALPFGPGPEQVSVITRVGAPPPPPVPPPKPWVRRMLDMVFGRRLTGAPDELVDKMMSNPTLVFLKQFRDVLCPTKACYQAVVEAPLAIHPEGASYLPLERDAFHVTVHDYATHPIATELGLPANQPVTPDHAFRATLNFDIMTGHEVWRGT